MSRPIENLFAEQIGAEVISLVNRDDHTDAEAEIELAASILSGLGSSKMFAEFDINDISDPQIKEVIWTLIDCLNRDVDPELANRFGLLDEAFPQAMKWIRSAQNDWPVLPLLRRIRNAARLRRALAASRLATATLERAEVDEARALDALELSASALFDGGAHG